jgi:transposase-like protein
MRLRYRDLEVMMMERGLRVDHTTMYRLSSNSLHPNWRSAVDPTSKSPMTRGASMRTSIKVKKQWVYLYRAVDSTSATRSISVSVQQEMRNPSSASF